MFSKQETEKIISNLQMVKEYCESSIIPKMRERDEVVGEFRTQEQRECRFCVRGNGEITLVVGALAIEFSDSETHLTYRRMWRYAVDLLANWQEVKQRLHTAIANNEAFRNKVTDGFVI